MPLEGSWGCEAPCPGDATPRASSCVSTRDSDMSSSCEMKDEPEFTPLQGNRAFFESARFGSIPLETENTGSLSRRYCKGKRLLRCLLNVGSPLQSKTGNQISSWDDMGCMVLSSSCCTEINIHIDLRLLSQGICVVC